MDRYIRYFQESQEDFNKRFEESLFSVTPKKFNKLLKDLCKRYNQYYSMLKYYEDKITIELQILHFNNKISSVVFDTLEDGIQISFIRDSMGFMNYKQSQKVKYNDFLKLLNTVCQINYRKVYKSAYNDVDMADYSKVRIM